MHHRGTQPSRARRLRILASPAWLKAPYLLVGFPAILASLVVAAVILGIAAAGGALFASSAGNALFDRALDAHRARAAGVTVAAAGAVDRARFSRARRALSDAAADLDELGRPEITIFTASRVIGIEGARTEARVRLLTRTGALAHIQRVAGGGGRGVWLAESSAEALGVGPGDQIELRYSELDATLRVAGIYRDLSRDSLSGYWAPMTFEIISPIQGEPPPPPFLIAGRDTFFDMKEKLAQDLGGREIVYGEQATHRFVMPLADLHMTLAHARRTAAEFLALRDGINDPLSPLGRPMTRLNAYGAPEVLTILPEIADQSSAALASLEAPVSALSIAGRVVALLVFAAAGLFMFQRRRSEVRLLSAQGVHPLTQGLRAALEASLPCAVGAVAGWALAVRLVEWLGPGRSISASVPAAALADVGWTTLLAIVFMGATFGAAARNEAHLGSHRVTHALSRMPWEPAVLALAAASLYELLTKEVSSTGVPGEVRDADPLLLAFPILFIAGMAGTLVRGLRRALPKLRRPSEGASAPLYLAARRLAATPRLALLLVTACAVALGVLVYSVTLVSVVQATRDAKAKVEAGSDVAAVISREGRRPPDLAVPSTSVLRTEVELFPGGEAADLLAVDPQDFEEVAFWDESFSDVPLEELLGRLEQKGPRLPAIVAGADLPERASIERIDAQVPLEIVAKVRAWPGMAVNKPLLVGDATRVARAVETRRSDLFDPFTSEELWARGEAPQVLNQLRDQGVVIESTRSAEEIRRRPELVSLSWTFGFMQAFGILVGSIALLGLVLYVQSRQQARLVSYALAARMGLSRSSHATAVALELAGMLGLSFLVGGALALIAARLAATRLDPMPQLPPGPVFSIPVLLIAAIPLVLIATSLLGAWLVQRAAERANVSDVMRLAV